MYALEIQCTKLLPVLNIHNLWKINQMLFLCMQLAAKMAENYLLINFGDVVDAIFALQEYKKACFKDL